MVRSVSAPTLVLGSTQDYSMLARSGTLLEEFEVLRRRAGGGVVHLLPGQQIWVDLWLPAGDPLLADDVARSAAVLGRWWARALQGAGAREVLLADRRAGAPRGLEGVCFASIGPGEVAVGGAKAVGISQWRGREGALLHSCFYLRVEPLVLGELLDLTDHGRVALERLEFASAESLGLDAFSTRALLDEAGELGGIETVEF